MLSWVLVLSLVSLVLGENNDPIVMVHGMGGSSRSWHYDTELGEASGLPIFKVSVHPYASNYDRAVEVYAQVKGLQVDYGVCHSRDNGHLRFGEDYTGRGLFPEWDENHRIHLFAHSMGGNTIRNLERLLEEGSGCAEDTSELFKGNNKWITSMTTIASPMDGVTIIDDVPNEDVLIDLFFVGAGNGDLDFPQWELIQEPDESMKEYTERLKSSGLLEEEDFSLEELRLTGAARFNSKGKQTFDGTFYFSFAGERTDPLEKCKEKSFLRKDCEIFQVPSEEMSGTDVKFGASIIGRKAVLEADRVNDGLVNQFRARCPTGENCKIVADELGEWTSEQWHTVLVDYLDHAQQIYRMGDQDETDFMHSAKRLYLNHGVRLKNLPSGSQITLTKEERFKSREQSKKVERFLRLTEFMQNEIEKVEENKSKKNGLEIFGVIAGVGLLTVAFVVVGIMTKRKFKSEPKVQSLNTTVLHATL